MVEDTKEGELIIYDFSGLSSGCRIIKGAAVWAGSIITKDLESWGIYDGNIIPNLRVRMRDLKVQGTKAFVWDFSGKMAMHGMGFVVSIFLARLLEPSDFGLIAMVIIGMTGVSTDIIFL